MKVSISGKSIDRFAGIDISSVALERAKGRIDGQFFLGDIQDFAPAGRWDLVYCSLVLYRQLRQGHQGAARILVNLLAR